MRKVLLLLAVPATALAIAALVGTVRRESLAQTPGAVVETFLRHLAHDRPEKARELMTPALERSVAADALERWEKEAADGLGELDSVKGETEWISGKESEATGVLEADRRERRLRFLLERGEDGRWAITRLDRFWGDSAGASDAAEAPLALSVRETWRERDRSVPRRPRSR